MAGVFYLDAQVRDAVSYPLGLQLPVFLWFVVRPAGLSDGLLFFLLA
jgi:hypothetical protein